MANLCTCDGSGETKSIVLITNINSVKVLV